MDGLAAIARLVYVYRMLVFLAVTISFCLFVFAFLRNVKKNWLIIILVTICYIVFLFHHFWFEWGERIVRNTQGAFFYTIRQYDNSADAYLDIQVYDGIYEKLERVYDEGVKEYYSNKNYRKCINFIDKLKYRYDEFFGDNHYEAPWENELNEYILKSYIGLYDDYRSKVDDNNEIKQKLFDLIFEIKKRYNNDSEIINSENGFYFEEDFNSYEAFEFLNENSYVEFGKVGLSTEGFAYNKKDIYWKLLIKENNKVYLICSTVLLSRYMNEEEIDTLDYKKTDIYKFLNNYLCNEMFNEKEKKAIISIESDENISLLSEDLINKMKSNKKSKYLSGLLSQVPTSYLVHGKNSFSYQKFWMKSDIKNKRGKCVAGSLYDELRIFDESATNDEIGVLPIICVNLDIIKEYAKEEREKFTEEKKQKTIQIEKEEKEKLKQSQKYKIAFREKMKAMKAVTEYPENTTIDDFDSIIIGNTKGYTGADKPINWILLKKTEEKALLLSKYSLYPMEYYSLVDFEPENKGKFNYRDFEDNHFDDMKFFNEDEQQFILSTKIEVSKNDSYPVHNDLNTIECKTFLLGIDDIKKYFSNNNGEILYTKLKTQCDLLNEEQGNENGWWLKDTGELWWTAAYIDSNGDLNERGSVLNNKLGYRRAMWVDIE